MSNEKFILAFDQGTTSSRSIIFDQSGTIRSVAQNEFRQIYPHSGWVEHDAMEIWSSQSATAVEALSRMDLTADSIAAIGVTNQRETTIVWHKDTGKPIYNAIVWQDRRTADYCRELRNAGHEERVTELTGLRIDPYFSGTKIRWILENVEGARELAKQGKLVFGTVDSWLIWQLTGHRVHVTDVTNASRTMLYNLKTGDWDDELLDLLDIPRSMMPEIRSCSEVYGSVDAKLPLGGVPIAGVAGDQQAALFGQACFTPGMAKNTYGTGCFLLMNTGTEIPRSKNNLLTTVAWRIGDRTEYALEGSVFIGGAVVQWIRDELQMVRTAKELDELAASVPDAGGLFLVPAFAGLGAPHWDPYARGAALGISRGTNRAHICRAALEGIAFQSADLITCMEKDSGLTLKELRVDGGASRSDPLLQFQADLLGKQVVRPKCVETTAMGAAYLAGLAVGYWQCRDDITKNWLVDKNYNSQRDQKDMDTLRLGWNKALERSKAWEA
ncbi:glycerol kinase GlpK [Cerasicoccus maritimus]|uniref:glycerol kinase GlpK n=1 Tax=Cerasicoccus maritimus TaxID=490089 RepID=UPI002852B831|nr:glycerol kinase GlpK [Cerasicoccus maritimus]